jgi:ATP-binding cassette subfamily F protein uup
MAPNKPISSPRKTQAPLIALKDVRLMDGSRPLFEGVDLALEPRVRATLVGRNGAGKSTLMRIMTAQIEPDSGVCTRQAGIKTAYVPQEPIPKGETLLDWALSDGAQSHKGASFLETFGLTPSSSTQNLSGGEKRRAALAKAFAEEPDVIFLDEPTNHLDIVAIETLESTLKAYRGSALIVSHDRAFLNRVTQVCFWLHDRRVLELRASFDAFDSWAEAQIKEQEESLRRLGKAIERETETFYRSITARRTRNEGRAARLRAMRSEQAQRHADQTRSLSLTMDQAQLSGRLVADLKNVSHGFGERTLFHNVTTQIMRGDRIAIIGPNGAGKTTFVKILLGEMKPDKGEVRTGTKLDIAYLDQSRETLKDDMTLWEALANEGSDQIMVRGQPKHVAAYAKDFLFGEHQLRQPIRTLSGGERNRLQLARALARTCNVLVLDEPTNDLDMETLDLLAEMLDGFDGTLILVSHDRDFINRLVSSSFALNGRGKMVQKPGGWEDFVRQNPGFLTGSENLSANKPSPNSKSKESAPKKLSFKDQHQLKFLEEQEMPRLQSLIITLEKRLEDPDFFSKQPDNFHRAVKELESARRALEEAETQWLILEDKRSNLGDLS